MITAEGLAKAGYRPFEDHAPRLKGNGCTCLWQKKIEDGNGVRYFINVYEWHLDKIIPNYPGPVPSFAPEVQFTVNAKGDVSDVGCGGRDTTIEVVEAYFDRMWRSMGFGYSELEPSYSGEPAASGLESVAVHQDGERAQDLFEALRQARAFIDRTSGTALGLAMSGGDHPDPDAALMGLVHDGMALSQSLAETISKGTGQAQPDQPIALPHGGAAAMEERTGSPSP